MGKVKCIMSLMLFLGLSAILMPKVAYAATVHQAGSVEELSKLLGNNLSRLQSGDTIQLTADINYPNGITISNKTITFDVNGHQLNVVNPNGSGLVVIGDVVFGVGVVNLIDTADGTGAFNVEGKTGVYVSGEDSKATVTNIRATGDNGYGVDAKAYTSVTVTGNITSKYIGINAASNADVYVQGNIIVNGDASRTCYGVAVYKWSPFGSYDPAIDIDVDGTVTVTGGNSSSAGVLANDGYVFIHGAIYSDNRYIEMGYTTGRNFNIGEGVFQHEPGYQPYYCYSHENIKVYVKAYSLKVETDGFDGATGSITGVTDGYYEAGRVFQITAVPSEDNGFYSWEPFDSKAIFDTALRSTTFIMPTTRPLQSFTLKACFLPKEYTCQVTYQGAQKRYDPDTNTYEIRLIGTLDTLKVDSVGFQFSKSRTNVDPASQVISTTEVYKSVTAAGSTVTAESFGAKYIIACTVTGIPEKDIDTPLYARAFSKVSLQKNYSGVIVLKVRNLPGIY